MSDTQVRYTLTLQDLLTRELDKANKSATTLEGTMSGLQNSINRVGAAVGVAFGIQQIGQFAKSVVDAGSTVENATIGLTTLLKDSGKAAEVVKNTMDDATKTPFAFEGLLQANRALISAGVNAESARNTVLDLGNAIAASGGGDVELQRMVVNLQQIKNTGKATAADIKQFGIAGINIYEVLGRAVGKHAKDMQDVEVSYDFLAYALRKAHEEGGMFAGGLERMAGATSVGLSNLGDAMFKLKVQIFEDLKPAITSLIETGMAAIQWLKDSWEWVKRNREMLFGLAKGILVGVVAFKAYKLALQAAIFWQKIQYASITLLGDGFLKANAATKLFAGGLSMIGNAVKANPLGLVLTAITALTTAYFAFSGSAEDARRENEKLNESLYETITSSGKRREEWITVMEEQFAAGGIKGSARLAEFKKLVDAEGLTLLQQIRENEKLMKETGYDKRTGLQSYIRDEKERKRLEQENRGYFAELDVLSGFKERGYRRRKAPEDISSDTPPPLVAKGGKSETGRVTGNKSTTINIKIENVVKEFNVKTVHFKESPEKARDLVAQALLSAINDSQRVGGQ